MIDNFSETGKVRGRDSEASGQHLVTFNPSQKVQYNQRRHHNNTGVDSHLQMAVAPQVHPQYIVDLAPGCVVYGDKGRHHYGPMHSKAEDWRCSMRQSHLSRAYGADPVEKGKKCIKPDDPVNGSEWPHSKRHDILIPDGRQASMRRGIEDKGLCVGFKSAKHFKARGEAPQYDMETFMNKKQRVRDINTMRNGIPVAVPGDRPFKKVEQEPGYFEKGGLIPGSSIQLRKPPADRETREKPEEKGDAAKREAVTLIKKKFIPYEVKQRMAREAYDRSQVLSLSTASTIQGQTILSFEARTGAYLVKPEDEAY